MPFCELDVISGNLMEWVVDPHILGGPDEKGKTIYNALFDKFEYAGRFTMHYEIKKKCTSGECELSAYHSSTIDKLNKGSASSVKTTDGYCNFHTHPFSCYAGEKTMWGWPSGEDMREVIGFMLRNNLFHLVFTLEGIYMTQVNPNFLQILLNDELLGKLIPSEGTNEKKNGDFLHPDRVRGIVISLIESYFKATHGHRGIQYNLTHRVKINTKEKKNIFNSKYWGICMPDDWVDFANKFKLSNMVNTGKNKCSKHLPCNCFPDYETKIGTIPLSEYLKVYGIDIYDLSSKGKICDVSMVQGGGNKEAFEDKYYKIIEKHFDKIINLFEHDAPNDLSYGGETWEPGQWFRVNLFYNEFQCDSRQPVYIDFLSWMTECIQREKTGNAVVPNIIHQFWERCQAKKGGLRFSPTDPARVMFIALKPPNGKTSCEVRHGDDIHNWIFSKTGKPVQFSKPKKRRKKSKKTNKRKKKSRFGAERKRVSEKNGKKRISSFGLNKHKR